MHYVLERFVEIDVFIGLVNRSSINNSLDSQNNKKYDKINNSNDNNNNYYYL